MEFATKDGKRWEFTRTLSTMTMGRHRTGKKHEKYSLRPLHDDTAAAEARIEDNGPPTPRTAGRAFQATKAHNKSNSNTQRNRNSPKRTLSKLSLGRHRNKRHHERHIIKPVGDDSVEVVQDDEPPAPRTARRAYNLAGKERDTKSKNARKLSTEPLRTLSTLTMGRHRTSKRHAHTPIEPQGEAFVNVEAGGPPTPRTAGRAYIARMAQQHPSEANMPRKSSPLRTFSSSAVDEHHKSDTGPKKSVLRALRIEEPGESLRTPPPTPGTAGKAYKKMLRKDGRGSNEPTKKASLAERRTFSMMTMGKHRKGRAKLGKLLYQQL